MSGREGPPIGIIQLDSRVKQVSFDQADLELLAAVAVPIGVVVENHGLLEVKASLAAAVEVQAGLLPRKRPVIAGYSFWERYQPALEVGGDYYDYIPVEDGPPVGCARWAVAVGDVAGKGMPAALLMASLSAEVRHLVRSGAVPNVAARRANLHVYEADLPGRFVTLALAEIDAATHQITLANAGHMPPLVRRADGTVTTIGTEEDSGLPLGIKRDETYGTITTVLAPGEVVVMFTDGVTDAMNKKDQPFGSDNLRKAVATAGRGPSQVGDDVLRALRAHVGSRPQFDDIALVCFGRD